VVLPEQSRSFFCKTHLQLLKSLHCLILGNTSDDSLRRKPHMTPSWDVYGHFFSLDLYFLVSIENWRGTSCEGTVSNPPSPVDPWLKCPSFPLSHVQCLAFSVLILYHVIAIADTLFLAANFKNLVWRPLESYIASSYWWKASFMWPLWNHYHIQSISMASTVAMVSYQVCHHLIDLE